MSILSMLLPALAAADLGRGRASSSKEHQLAGKECLWHPYVPTPVPQRQTSSPSERLPIQGGFGYDLDGET
jgi:hypothetical protein